MGRWTVGDEANPLATVEDQGQQVLVHIPSPLPVLVTTDQAEEFRAALAMAIGVAKAGQLVRAGDEDA